MPAEVSPFQRLRVFYQERFRPVYDRFSSNGNVPQEIHAELAAAFDHFLRKTEGDATSVSEHEVERIIGHVKRATFDAFKLVHRDEIKRAYTQLLSGRYAEVHDGRLHAEANALWNRAREISMEARQLESLSGKIDTESWNRAFDKWNELLPIADEFARILASDEIARAAAKSRWHIAVQVGWGLLLAVLGVVLGKVF